MASGPGGNMFAFTRDPAYWQFVNSARNVHIRPRGGVGQFVAGGHASQSSAAGAAEVAARATAPAQKRARTPAAAVKSAGGRTAQGKLTPPSNAALVDQNADLLPTPAEASAKPELLGESGDSGGFTDARRQVNLQAVQQITAQNPASVTPENMGVSTTANAGPTAAVSTQHAPDMGVESSALERSKQLPSSAPYQSMIHQMHTAQNLTNPGGGGGDRSKRRRAALFSG